MRACICWRWARRLSISVRVSGLSAGSSHRAASNDSVSIAASRSSCRHATDTAIPDEQRFGITVIGDGPAKQSMAPRMRGQGVGFGFSIWHARCAQTRPSRACRRMTNGKRWRPQESALSLAGCAQVRQPVKGASVRQQPCSEYRNNNSRSTESCAGQASTCLRARRSQGHAPR